MPALSPRLYFENAAGRILEHPDQYVIFEYKAGPRQMAHLQALLTHTQQLLQRTGWFKILADQRQMAPFTDEESAWIANYWLDRSRHRPGGIYGAIVLANDVFARLTMSQVMLEAQASALTYRMFDSTAAAVAWLKSVE